MSDVVTNEREFLYADETPTPYYWGGVRLWSHTDEEHEDEGTPALYLSFFYRGRINIPAQRRAMREARAADRDPLGMAEWDGEDD